ncbi:cysteine synthase A [Amaricoccus macauensis]|uniref:L-cysteine desulfhydrase Cds1 n=1 Tax=Amaricoccus macauensis TaxID=57001 RepID=A0A840SIM7_9RHOB|nr:PLP-dependent cysteine synthase family protein [Amaricoccus macauensis]MBB5222899.1 cysteine synthase A [Amaricoccus macauensis]
MPDQPPTAASSLPECGGRPWTRHAINVLSGDAHRSADTHLLKPLFEGLPGISVYLKDESTHPTGSLKHRLARSLFLYGICNGGIHEGTVLVEASSGSTAVSEAYFARLLGLRFIAVMPRRTSPSKIEAIARFGGECCFVDSAGEVYEVAARLAREHGGYYLDQFTYAERATDWRGNNNIAESIFRQLEGEEEAVPEWVVVSAGTGGTAATLGRFIRYRGLPTRLCVADVEGSAFYDAWRTRDRGVTAPGSRIEGIGRPRVEPSFVPGVIDHMIRVPDAASIAAAHVLSERLFRRVGGSTGTNFFALCSVAADMMREGRGGALVTMICDSGDRYADSYYDPAWLAREGIDIAPWRRAIEGFLEHGGDLALGSASPLSDTSASPLSDTN